MGLTRLVRDVAVELTEPRLRGGLFMRPFKVGAVTALFGWPVFSTWNAFAIARESRDPAEKVVTFLKLTPSLILSVALWAALWGLALPPVLASIWR
jgi:hypothetical protein